MKPTQAVMILALAGSLGACADSGSVPSAPEERQLTGPQFAPPSAAKCNLNWDLTLLDMQSAVRSDPLGVLYQDRVDRVIVQGGDDGFRFDTNGSQQHEAANDIRRVQLVLPAPHQAHADTLKGIDFRFNLGSGLNLCGLMVDSSKTRTALLTFVSDSTGGLARLLWGSVGVFSCPDSNVLPLTITRLTDVGSPPNNKRRFSVVSGPTACFIFSGAYQATIGMPIAFTITEQ